MRFDIKGEHAMENQTRIYSKQWFMWIMLIAFAPIGIFLMWKYQRFSKVHRIALSCIFALIFLLISISGQSISTTNTTSTNKTTSIAVADDHSKAAAVDKAIADLGDPNAITTGSVSKIRSARKAYNALTEAQKKYVTNYNDLKTAEDQMRAIEKTADEQQTATDSVGGKLKVHFINVGQGDSILIQQGSSSMLVDAGSNAESLLVIKYISSQGITNFDYVIGTHPHEDHIGGLDYVINAFSISKIYMPKAQANTKTFEDVLTAISNKGMRITTPVQGDSFKLGDANVTILAPNGSNYNDLNNYSIVLKVKYGNTSFMLDGDAELLSESQMLSKGFNMEADVLKIGHHGSSSSTSETFLNKVNPKYAVISAGAGNSYGHPTEQTMSRLKDKGITVYRTDECGTIVVTSDGSSISFSTAPGSYQAEN